MDRRRVVFSGRVQGVGFRASSLALAQHHEVTGWVKNEADATVTLEVQGIAPEVEAYLDRVRTTLGRFIRHEQALSIPAVAGETGFRIVS